MTILNKLSIRNLILNKKRTISTIIGIILSVALICGVATLVSSFQKTLVDNAIDETGYYHLNLMDITNQNLDELKNNKDISNINIVNQLGYGFLEGSQNEYKPYIKLFSMDNDTFKYLNFKLIEGRFPQNSKEVIISKHIIENAGVEYNIGDKISLNVGQRKTLDMYDLQGSNPYIKDEEQLLNTENMEFTIVGIIKRPNNKFEEYVDPGYTVITTGKESGKINAYITFKNVSKYKTSIANIFGLKSYNDFNNEALYNNLKYDTYSINDELLRWEAFAFSDSTVEMLYAASGIVMAIIIFTSVFCIRNSFAIAMTEKMKMYGMLASVGATKKQIKKNVISEALILGIIGIPLGIIGGVFAIFVLIKIVNNILADTLFSNIGGISFSVSLISIISATILGLIVIYLSSISSANKASKVSPIESLRASKEIKLTSKKLKTPKIISKLFKTGGVLSYKNLKRSKRKYRTTVISITVSVFIFISMNSFLTNAFDFADMYYTDYDYNIELYGMNRESLNNDIAKIEKLQGIDALYKFYSTGEYNLKIYDRSKINDVPGEDEYSDSSEENYPLIQVVGLDRDSFEKYCKKIGKNYEKVKSSGILCDEYKYYDLDSKNTKIIRRYKYNEKDNIIGIQKDKEVSINVAAVTDIRPYSIEDSYYIDGYLVLNIDEYKNIDFYLDRVCINSSDSEKLVKEIEKFNSDIKIIDFDKTAREQKAMVLVINIFLYGFISVITLIGVTNIFNTITSNMELRQREFATLKSIGMTRKEFNRMINLETIFYCVKALLYGIILGLISTFAMYKAFTIKLDKGMYIPILPIIISIICVFILVFIIMEYSISKINKQNIIETIRNENI